MPLPENFNDIEFLQDMVLKQHNAVVREYFSDLSDDWEPEVATSRGRLRQACTMKEADTYQETTLRMRLLYDVLGYAKSNLAVIHGSTAAYESPVQGHPKVRLYFSQDSESIPKGYSRIDAEISFRLMNETAATFTEANAITLANKIKTQFISARKGIVFTKGKDIYAYKDVEKGYRLQVYCMTEADAVDVIRRSLEVQDIAFHQANLTKHEPKKTSNPKPGKHLVYGKQRNKKQYRPIANVRFRYAVCQVPGLAKEIALVDTTGRLSSVVIQ